MGCVLDVWLLMVTLDVVVGVTPLKDTQLVGSTLHHMIADAPIDLLVAGDHSRSYKNRDGKKNNDRGYVRTQSVKGGDGYAVYDSFHKKDGDKGGFEKHTAYGSAKADDNNGEYAVSGSYDSGDATANKPKFTSYHYETKSGSPTKKYVSDDEDQDDESEETKPEAAISRHRDVEITGPISGPKFQSLGDRSGQYTSSRSRQPRKVINTKKKKKTTKDPQTAASEGDYYYESSEGDGDEGGDSGGYDGEYEGDYYASGGESDYY